MLRRALVRTQPCRTNIQWQPQCIQQPQCIHKHLHRYTSTSTLPIIDIRAGTFYKHHPNSTTSQANPPLFPNLSYTLANTLSSTSSTSTTTTQNWAIISPSSLARTTFLQILSGAHIAHPPTSRRYPFLSTANLSPHQALKYVGFDAERGTTVSGSNVRGAYLSARYESRREETDFTVRQYLTGHTELNALEREATDSEREGLKEVVGMLELGALMGLPVASLSNGQTRRARIARAVVEEPEVLLLDGPFMGLDPRTLKKLEGVLGRLAGRGKPRVVVSLRPEDEVPEWISHVVVVDENLKVLHQGSKDEVLEASKDFLKHSISAPDASNAQQLSRDGFPKHSPPLPKGSPLVEFSGVRVSYGPKTVLGDWHQPSHPSPGLHWTLHSGQRCGIFGPNGSGKTTMLSLITSDHPQTYGLPIKLFGRSRLPTPGQPGISVFDLQRRMGHSSPEVHAFFPKRLSLRRTLESAWADAPLAKPVLDGEAKKRVDATLRWFADDLRQQQRGAHISTGKPEDEVDLSWAEDMLFGELSFSAQRLALFLRAIVHRPPLIILDEAFSWIDETVRDRALSFLSHGENGEGVMEGLGEEQALLVISHAKEDVPGCMREWICLPEPGEEQKAPRMGELKWPLELNPEGWGEIWGSGEK